MNLNQSAIFIIIKRTSFPEICGRLKATIETQMSESLRGIGMELISRVNMLVFVYKPTSVLLSYYITHVFIKLSVENVQMIRMTSVATALCNC